MLYFAYLLLHNIINEMSSFIEKKSANIILFNGEEKIKDSFPMLNKNSLMGI